MAGRCVFPREHPLCFQSQSPAADTLRQKADAMLIVGSRVGNIEVAYDKHWGDPDNCRIVQIDVDALNIGVSRPAALGIVSDARIALEGLAGKLRQRDIASRDRAHIATMRQDLEAWVHEAGAGIHSWQGPGIHPAHAIAAVGKVFGEEAVCFTDGGLTSLWGAIALPSTQPSSPAGSGKSTLARRPDIL